MKKQSLLALTLGVSLAVGSLAVGTYGIGQANDKPRENQCMKFQQNRPMHDSQEHQEMLKLLQIDEQTFKQEKSSGKSMAEIAANHNVSRQAIIDLMSKHMNERIDGDLAQQKLTSAQADEMKAHVQEKAQEMVDHKMMGHGGKPHR